MTTRKSAKAPATAVALLEEEPVKTKAKPKAKPRTKTAGKSAKTKTTAKRPVTASAKAAATPEVEVATTEAVKPKAPRRERAASRSGTKGSRTRATDKALSDIPIEEIWSMYREEATLDIRNFLVEKYFDLVRFTAERMAMRLPSEVDTSDLMSAGSFGLMDAINAYDPDRNVKFETYCTQRIRGAIFDELRAMDWVPRLVRSRTAKVERARKQIEMESGQKATDAEISSKLEVDKDEYKKICRDARPVGVVSLNRKWFETDSSKDVREIDVVRDRRQENPVSRLQRDDLKLLLTKGLSRAERLIIVLYYYEEMTMKEIGITLDLSESRVSQMHSSILARLKAQMQHRSKEF